jgi:Tfp pilus assembly protein PilX
MDRKLQGRRLRGSDVLTALRRRLSLDREEGYVLIMVVGSMLALSIFVAGSLTYAVQTRIGSRYGQDYTAALAAAQAGVDDYLAALNQNDDYWLTTPDCANQAMKRPPQQGQSVSCGWGSGTDVGWKRVGTSQTGAFHYDADITNTPSNGTIKLTSTGKVGAAKRTVQVILRRDGFGEFLYFTKYETTDPATVETYGPNNSAAKTNCTKYAYAPDNRPLGTGTDDYLDGKCPQIRFIQGDVLDGPVHSDDELVMDGADFKGTVTTSRPGCVASDPSTCYFLIGREPVLEQGIGPRAEIPMPTSVANTRQYADPAVTSDPGCLYTGSTRIKFLSNGQMTVWSKGSGAPLNPDCGSSFTTTPMQTMAIPNNKIIYVQSKAGSGSCATGAIGDGLPVAGDFNNTLPDATCNYGNVYVEGTVKGRVTIVAENNIVVTGNLTYAGGKTGTDALGLIANDFVRVYHPVSCPTSSGTVCDPDNSGDSVNLNRPNGNGKFTDPVVNAAILALNHSFSVQLHSDGATLGDLSIFGSIAQKFRGPVGSSRSGVPVSGYNKDYVYDSRLRYSPPPYFIDPSNSRWGAKTFAENTVPSDIRSG